MKIDINEEQWLRDLINKLVIRGTTDIKDDVSMSSSKSSSSV